LTVCQGALSFLSARRPWWRAHRRSNQTAQHHEQGSKAQAAAQTAAESARAWFSFANSVIDETDRHIEESIKAMQKLYEQYAAGRRNFIKLVEEGMEKSISVATTFASNFANTIKQQDR
jgi:hypothetical protein